MQKQAESLSVDIVSPSRHRFSNCEVETLWKGLKLSTRLRACRTVLDGR